MQPGTRTLLTEIDVPNPDGALQPGIYCTVELHIPRKTPSLIVPADAHHLQSERPACRRRRERRRASAQVTIARDFGTTVEVNDGVKAGDQVVLNPAVNLADGSKVTIRKVEVS